MKVELKLVITNIQLVGSQNHHHLYDVQSRERDWENIICLSGAVFIIHKIQVALWDMVIKITEKTEL
jgi:hypothetical protein